MLRLAEVEIGAAFEADTAAIIEKRLRATGKFQKVEVLKRFASIADPSKISVVIVVDEGDVKIEWDQGSERRAAHRQASRAWSDVPADSRRAGRVRLDLRRALCGAERGRLAEPRRLPAHVGRRQARGRAVREGFRPRPARSRHRGPVRLPARAPVLRTRRRSVAAVGEGGARSAAEASSRGHVRHRTRAVPGRRHPVPADRRRPRARHASRSRARAQCRLRPRRLGPLRGHRSGDVPSGTASTSAATRD